MKATHAFFLVLATLAAAPLHWAEEPQAILRPAPPIFYRGANSQSPDKAGETDCNSPLHWEADTMFVFNSAGHPFRSSGRDIFSQTNSYVRTEYNNKVNGGRWIEATWKADNGTLYGWYHNEPGGLCPGTHLTAPLIGAARSSDNGGHWEDLGIVLEVRPDTLNCKTANYYFAGGNGDFSVLPDARREYVYFYISTYIGGIDEQGVAVARMPYSDLDKPVGKVSKWHNGKWSEPGLRGRATPIWPGRIDWHQPDADAFWGPSIHWNTHLGQYVLLLNRSKDANWTQEGIYVSFNKDLGQPQNWSTPKKILGDVRKDEWYPQVVGLNTAKKETDKLASSKARFFLRGHSRWEIFFLKPGEKPE